MWLSNQLWLGKRKPGLGWHQHQFSTGTRWQSVEKGVPYDPTWQSLWWGGGSVLQGRFACLGLGGVCELCGVQGSYGNKSIAKVFFHPAWKCLHKVILNRYHDLVQSRPCYLYSTNKHRVTKVLCIHNNLQTHKHMQKYTGIHKNKRILFSVMFNCHIGSLYVQYLKRGWRSCLSQSFQLERTSLTLSQPEEAVSSIPSRNTNKQSQTSIVILTSTCTHKPHFWSVNVQNIIIVLH